MRIVKKLISLMEGLYLRLAAVFFFIFFACITLQVASRYIPGIEVLWASEIATYAFIWMVFLGAAVMVRQRGHFTVGLVIDSVKGLPLLILQSVIHLLLIGFGIVMIKDGYSLTVQFWGWTLNNLPQIRQGYTWLAIPTAGAGVILFSLQNWLEDMKSFRKQGKGDAS
ncbi:TRAP transporter small permease [Salibacterium qingdaonense]|uniref:TRAP-type C4-dicarboxylate transport system, small permease component n=1 Tax=Salibacterium qingdaonense TaxID=266892 RepID=A0A1I4LD89_9BACI|nr:TRAP transporter small permease [Salibacterium qingdaonense]SFL89038.1 TRAP-type C4-dicarboxylate transport system, small permease component [Salibacterium qingdaonense]